MYVRTYVTGIRGQIESRECDARGAQTDVLRSWQACGARSSTSLPTAPKAPATPTSAIPTAFLLPWQLSVQQATRFAAYPAVAFLFYSIVHILCPLSSSCAILLREPRPSILRRNLLTTDCRPTCCLGIATARRVHWLIPVVSFQY